MAVPHVQAADGIHSGFDRPNLAPAAASPRRTGGVSAASPAVRTLQAAGDPNVAREVVTDQLDRFTHQLLPPLIARFLEKHWRAALMRVHVIEGEHSQSWTDLLASTEDLVWSVLPKTDEESRKKLFALLPGLLRRLHAGLESLGLPAADEDAFFAELAKLHVTALHPEPQALSQAPERSAQTPSPVHPPSADAGEVAPETANPPECVQQPECESPAQAAPIPSEPSIDPVASLGLGAVVEFRGIGACSRSMALTWISGKGGVFLFKCRNGSDTLALTASRLAERLHEGSAQIYG
jgi:hypothetical protein